MAYTAIKGAGMKDVEIIGVLKTYIKKMFATATISTVAVTQTVSNGNQLAEIDVSGNKTNVYMPSVKVNGKAQTVTSNELDLNVADNLITEAQWTALQSIFS